MKLTTATPVVINRGYHFVQASMTSGSAAATISIDGLSAVAHADFTFAASGYILVALPECTITPTLTGDAQMAIEPVAVDAR